jgi:DNA-directed RNA polymerase I and III subunit RPAC1
MVEKGIGRDHAKWQPVCTVRSRLLPKIIVDKGVIYEQADQLVSMSPQNVFDIEEIGGIPKALPKRPRDCSMCRECIREPEWAELVKLRRVRDQYLCRL